MSNPVASTGDGWGCLTIVLGVVAVWALLFGVTCDGKHYGMHCSCDRGVQFDTGAAR